MTSPVWTAAPSPSRGWQSTHSVNLFPARPSFLSCFLFLQFPFLTDEYPGQVQGDLLVSQSLLVNNRQVANTGLFSFILPWRDTTEMFFCTFFRRLKGITCVAPLLTWQDPGRGLHSDLLRTLIWNLFSVSLSSFITHTSHCSSYGID